MLFRKSFIILLFLPLYSFPQNNYVFQHLTVEDGLLSNPRVNVFQDAEGFYWFSSASGIQRFDGKNFISYIYANNGTKNSTGEWVGKPVEDKEKNIWIFNDDGISIYQRKHGTFARLYLNDAADSNVNNVSAIIKDEQQQIWIITTRNIFLYNYESRQAVLFSNILNDANSSIAAAIYDTKRNNFWLLISRNGSYEIALFDYIKKQITWQINTVVKDLLHSYKTISLFKLDGSGNIWMSDFAGNFCRYNTLTHQLSHYSILQEANSQKNRLNYSEIYDFIDDENGTIWFGGESIGLLKYNKSSDSFTSIKFENGSEYGLHYDQTIFSFLIQVFKLLHFRIKNVHS